ncbi:MAG: SdrD B-like domain-containing protein [bacterium]|nr:SdrD B-like domain-containing protein [bacterium]
MGRSAYISAWLPTLLVLAGFSQVRAYSFMNLEYRDYLYQPSGQRYYQAYYRIGSDQTAGDFRTRYFLEFNDNAIKDPALNRIEMQFSGWKFLGGRWDASLGDITMSPVSPGQSSVSLRGTKLVTGWGQKISAETFAGRIPDLYHRANFPTFNNNNILISQGIKGILSKQFNFKSRVSYRRDKKAELYYSYLKAKDLCEWANRVEWDLRPNLRGQHQLALSYNRDFNGIRRTDISGSSSWEYFNPWFRSSADYQYRGPGYISSANDGNGCGENQLALSSSGVLLKKITLFGNYSQKWARTPDDTTLFWNQFQKWGTGLQTAIPRWPLFSYKFDRYTWGYHRGRRTFQDMVQYTNSLELQYNWRLYLWRLGYQLQESRDLIAGSQRLWHQGSLTGSYRMGSFGLNLDQRGSRYNSPKQLQWSQSFGFDQRWGRLLNTSLSANWCQGNSETYRWKTENWGWSLKAGTDRTSGWNLSADLGQNYYYYSDLGPVVRNTSWGFKLERRFDGWGQLVSLGQINGRVYEDANGNMTFDNGDKGIPGIPIMIDGKEAAQTGRSGEYRVLGVAAGSHSVKMDISKLDAGMDPSIGGQRRFTTVGVWGPRVDFPLAPLNEIYGNVFLDENRNGIRDEEDAGLPGVFVLMGDNRRFTASDNEGDFIFHNVQPGRYRVFIDPRFLPDTLAVTGEQQRFIEVENKNDVGGVAFGIGKKVRPVRKMVFAPSQVTEPGPKTVPVKPGRSKTGQPVKQIAKASAEEIKRLYDLGIKQYSTGDYQSSMTTWNQLLRIDPGNGEARKNRDRTKGKLDALQKIKGQ